MAIVFGAAGLYIAWSAFGQGTDPLIGLTITGVAMVLLFMFTFAAGMRRTVKEHPVAKRVPVAPVEIAEAPTPVKMSRDDKARAKHAQSGGIDFEYPDELVEAPTEFEPPVGFQEPPRGTVVTTDRATARPPRAYGQPVQEREMPSHAALTQKYTDGAPMMRDIMTKPTLEQIPEFQAELADPMQHPAMLPPNTVRGKCGQCDTLLLAPTQRPIKLRCPSCTRATLLEA